MRCRSRRRAAAREAARPSSGRRRGNPRVSEARDGRRRCRRRARRPAWPRRRRARSPPGSSPPFDVTVDDPEKRRTQRAPRDDPDEDERQAEDTRLVVIDERDRERQRDDWNAGDDDRQALRHEAADSWMMSRSTSTRIRAELRSATTGLALPSCARPLQGWRCRAALGHYRVGVAELRSTTTGLALPSCARATTGLALPSCARPLQGWHCRAALGHYRVGIAELRSATTAWFGDQERYGAMPSPCCEASITISLTVGCAWMMEPSSSMVNASDIATATSWMISTAWIPTIVAPRIRSEFASATIC